MIKTLVYLIIILIGLIISPYLSGIDGYLYLAIGDYELETSVVFAIFAIILFYMALVVIEWLVIGSLNLLLRSRFFPEKWRRKMARKHTLRGALALAEEDWSLAEKAMVKGAAKGEIPALNLLAAARAAQHQDNTAARDRYLLDAEQQPQASHAVLTTRARYLLKQGELKQARAALDRLNPTSKSKLPVLRLALEIYQAQQDWSAVQLLLPTINQRSILTKDEYQNLNEKTNCILLKEAVSNGEQALEKVWQWLGRQDRNQPTLIAQYALGIAKFDRKSEAVKLLLKPLRTAANQQIFMALSKLLLSTDLDARKQLFAMEKRYGDNADYQECIATLYDQNKDYRESQLRWAKVCQLAPSRKRLMALGEVHEHLGEQNLAIQSYRKAAVFEETSLTT